LLSQQHRDLFTTNSRAFSCAKRAAETEAVRREDMATESAHNITLGFEQVTLLLTELQNALIDILGHDEFLADAELKERYRQINKLHSEIARQFLEPETLAKEVAR
jgi:hypothetical protein